MNIIRAAALALMIVVAAPAGQAGAQGVLDILRRQSAPETCERFETALEIRDFDWSAIDVVREVPARTDDFEETLQMRGGLRVVLEVDAAAVRKDMIEMAREEILRIVRDARLGSPSAVTVRDDVIEFRLGAGFDAAVASKALSALTSGPEPLLTSRSTDDERASGLLTFAVSDRAVEERRASSRPAAIEWLGRPARHGPPVLVQDLGDHRILMVIAGVTQADLIPEDFETRFKLMLRIAERFVDPCIPPLPDTEVLKHVPGRESAVVRKQVVAGSDHVAEVVAVRDIRTGLPAVALRLNRSGSDRLAKATQENVERSLAVVLGNGLIAMPTIREPITGNAVLVSGDLTLEQATELAKFVRAGLMPPRLTVIEKQVVAPGPR